MNKRDSFRMAFSIAAASLLAGCAATTDLSSIPVKVSEFGQMTNLRKQALYTYDKDIAGSGRSSCNDACAKTWTAFLVGPQDAPSGDFSFVARSDGSRQWAYMGQPIYFYSGSNGELDAWGSKGDGPWHVLWYPVSGARR